MVNIQDKIEEWREHLLDLSRRNRLINCHADSQSFVSIAYPLLADVWALLRSDTPLTFAWRRDLLPDLVAEDDEPNLLDAVETAASGRRPTRDDFQRALDSPELSETDILTSLTDRELNRRLYRLSLNAKTSISEQGVNTLYLAVGFLRYFESPDSDIPVLAPLLMVPVELSRVHRDSPWQLTVIEDEVQPNHCLGQLLKTQFDLDMPEYTGTDDNGDADGLSNYFDKLREFFTAFPKWGLVQDALLGIFSFQKITMWKDLGDHHDAVGRHELCVALAGGPQTAPVGETSWPSGKELDAGTRPRDTFHILDTDSSQHEAVLAATKGLSFVIDGPPGTGKSQTIANIIAEFIAAGRTVLFVSEKVAALEVVKRRLDTEKLGDFCLELHSHKASKKVVVQELGRCLTLRPEAYADQSESLDRLVEARNTLNQYVDALHTVQSSLKLSAFQVHGRLAAIKTTRVSQCPVAQVHQVSQTKLDQLTQLVGSLRDYETIISRRATHPWQLVKVTHHSLSLEDDLKHILQQLANYLEPLLPVLHHLEALGFCGSQVRWKDLRTLQRLVQTAATAPQIPSAWLAGESDGLRAPARDAPKAREIADTCLRLDELTRQWREGRHQLSHYVDHAFDQQRSEVLQRFIQAESRSPDLLRQSLPPMVGDAVAHLEAVEGTITKLTDGLQKLDEKLDDLAKSIGVPYKTPPTLNQVERIIKLARAVAKIGVIKRHWCEPASRQSIRGRVDEAIAEMVKIEALRVALGGRLARGAFESDVADNIAEVERYQSLFYRWSAGWRAFRRWAAGLYLDLPPKRTRQLLADMVSLRQYHRRVADLRQFALSNTADIPCDATGEVDWRAVQESLETLEELTREMRLPDRLKDALSSGEIIDREGLVSVADEVEQLIPTLDAQLQDLEGRLKVAAVSEVTATIKASTLRPAAARAGFIELWAKGQPVLDALREIRLLTPQSDGLTVQQVVEDLKGLSLLWRLRQEIRSLAASVGPAAFIDGPPEVIDWGVFAEHAAWVRQVATQKGMSLPQPVVRTLTDAATRDQVHSCHVALQQLIDERLDSTWEQFAERFDLNKEFAEGLVLGHCGPSQLVAWLRARTADISELKPWLEFCELCGTLRSAGMGTLVDEALERSVPAGEAEPAFLARFYRLWLDAAYQQHAALRRFDSLQHEQLIENFRQMDRRVVAGTFKRVRSLLLQRPVTNAIGQDAPTRSERGILLAEANKQRRHLPLRQLFRFIPGLLRQLKPCLMMSPLSVSTYLDSAELQFDLVIFDEASQVRPHDAVSAIYRGKQLVVAGDPKQLPPTAVFERMQEDGEEGVDDDTDELPEQDLADFESILDVCRTIGLTAKTLKWHYRSRRESLIAFSNHYFYENRLITFPSVLDQESAVSRVHVPKGVWTTGVGGRFNRPEAKRVAELVYDQFRRSPDESLGVVTMNLQQQLAVLEELERLRSRRPEYEQFFDETGEEPFFVKNLENVQGDERDRMIFSVGYAPDETGKFSMQFGTLNRRGGERRMNVAITRARKGVTVVTSIRGTDIDVSRTQSQGVKLLRAYLEYAERGISALGGEITASNQQPFESEFEREVARALEAEGLAVHHQIGCSGYRIDLALVHPEHQGLYMLGIECDGATYHSGRTARERDRLRQEVLEGLGWRIHRVWSTDWVRHPSRQIEKILAAYRTRLQEIENGDAAGERPETKESDDEKPQLVRVEPTRRRRQYSAITDVPKHEIHEITLEILSNNGATEIESLLAAITHQLGFNRVGPRIRDALQQRMDFLAAEKAIQFLDNDRVRLGPNRFGQPSRDLGRDFDAAGA